MKTFTTKSGYQIIQLLSGRANVWLVEAGSIRILVDTGITLNRKKLLNKLNPESLRSRDSASLRLNFLLLTHTHFDHCQNAAWLKNRLGCKIIVGESAKEFVRMGYTPIPGGVTRWARFVVRLGRKFRPGFTGYAPFQADMIVKEKFTFALEGVNLEIIPTPGHSSDSISLLVDGEVAIVGDTLYGMVSGKAMPPFADDVPLLKQQWKVLLDTGCQWFLPGHGKPISAALLQKFI
ncbi:MAG TPA: MBL fold metallo-hydrolase [Bacteroidales bacterium]|nr:MBL fold metallo-hydrolase [Bacteroidales bacterium]HRZ50090.1 MBL fold metallo-hydrolase [Bacteroidales bacterium]